MGRIRGKGTVPENRVESALKSLRVRYKKQAKELPGKPDFIIPNAHLAIFVHGCFWHQHPGCSRCATPKTRMEYWGPKLDSNVGRFTKVRKALRNDGWRVHVVWECQTRSERLAGRLERRLLS